MQRVSIGRAIVREPSVFLMDEPLSALDAKLRETLRVELKSLHHDLGATFLFVTHDQVEAMSMGDKIGVLRSGRLVQVGTPSDIYERAAQHLRGPLGRLAADEPDRGHASPVAAPRSTVTTCLSRRRTAREGTLTFGVRPENLVLEPGAPAEARVFDIEDQGVIKILALDMDGTRLHATVPAGTRINRDEVIRFGWKTGTRSDLRPEDRQESGSRLIGSLNAEHGEMRTSSRNRAR